MAEIVLKRKLFGCCALATALLAPPAALAVTTANSGVVASAAGARVVSHGSVSGTIGAVNGASFTLQTPGRRTGVVTALIAAANRILNEDTPYVYGGGHTSAGNASIGIPGPGYNGRRIGFDCSGAVGAVLVGAGLWTPGSGVPRDDGIITQLRSEGLIAPGVGKGPVEVTLWDRPTVHIFMNIDGRFFGTSDGADGGDANGHHEQDPGDGSVPHRTEAYALVPPHVVRPRRQVQPARLAARAHALAVDRPARVGAEHVGR